MTESQQIAKLNEAITDLANDPDIKDAVTAIESSTPTTQHNYGRYMAILSPYAKDRTILYVMSQALIVAGANRSGVASALQVIG